ncbi:MAG TPA: hypothetical protein DD490_17775 [Acidobacteria bacterium]|nr:hypothetical protein [Acidobacteriota bacterium]
MATNGTSNPERIARWKVMAAGLKPQLPQLPMLGGLHAELEGTIQRSEELDARHEALKAEIREVNRLRKDLVAQGDDLRKRLAASLQTVHGFESEKLIEYGVKPRRLRGRDRQARKRRALLATTPTTVPVAEPAAAPASEPAATPTA